jgi:hypothetical protein
MEHDKERLMKACILAVLVLSLPGVVSGGSLSSVRYGHLLGENDVSLKLDYRHSEAENAAINRYMLDLAYGVSSAIEFGFRVPLVTLHGIEDSLILADLEIGFQFQMGEWESGGGYGPSILFAFTDFKIGTGVKEGEGKFQAGGAEKVLYYPFVGGLTQWSVGVGYSVPLGTALDCHLNFEYRAETRDQEGAFDFDLKNDSLRLSAALDYYLETEWHLFGTSLNLGFKPFVELGMHVPFGVRSAMPARLDMIAGFWFRPGSVFRLTAGMNFPAALETDRFLVREFFINLAAVLR